DAATEGPVLGLEGCCVRPLLRLAGERSANRGLRLRGRRGLGLARDAPAERIRAICVRTVGLLERLAAVRAREAHIGLLRLAGVRSQELVVRLRPRPC